MNGVIRGRCPRCGGKIIYSEFYQNARDYTIRKDGKVPKRYVSRSGELSESVAACENGCGAYWEDEDFSIGQDGMPYGTKPETDEWRAAVCRLSRLMNWTTPERFMLVNEIRREQPNMEKPIFSFMGVPITEDSAGKLAEAMKKSGVSALEVVAACETLKKISKALLGELPGVPEEEHND